MTLPTSPFFLLLPSDNSGCGFYRVKRLGKIFADLSGIDHVILDRFPTRLELSKSGVAGIFTQRQIETSQVSYWTNIRRSLPDIPVIMDIDDSLWNAHKTSAFKPTSQHIENFFKVCGLMSKVTCSTLPLAEDLQERGISASVIPNVMSSEEFTGKLTTRTSRQKMRILWSGSDTHQDDLEQIVGVVKATRNEYDWVFMGYCPPAIKDDVTFIKKTGIGAYHRVMREIGAHVGIAPLVNSQFNRCKSNLKILEYGAMGLATVASNVYPYRGSPGALVEVDDFAGWISALADLENEEFRIQSARIAREYAGRFVDTLWSRQIFSRMSI